MSIDQLDRIAAELARPADGYPPQHDRLFLGTPGLRAADGILYVPAGPWHVTGHPNRAGAPAARLDPDVPGPGGDQVDPRLTARWRAAGLLLDQHGRPIHPDWQSLLGDKRIGLPTGLGYFWHWGPNATVDAYVERAGRHGAEILLIQRRPGQWALPGGFADRGDSSDAATALRELGEETGLRIPAARTEPVLTQRPTGPMATLHAWTENTVVRVAGDPRYLAETEPVAGDDAIDAAWFPVEEARGMNLFSLHSQYIAQITHAPAR